MRPRAKSERRRWQLGREKAALEEEHSKLTAEIADVHQEISKERASLEPDVHGDSCNADSERDSELEAWALLNRLEADLAANVDFADADEAAEFLRHCDGLIRRCDGLRAVMASSHSIGACVHNYHGAEDIAERLKRVREYLQPLREFAHPKRLQASTPTNAGALTDTEEWAEEERLLSWKTTSQLEIDLQSDDNAPNQFAPAYAYAGEGSGDEKNTYMVEGVLQQYQLFVRGNEVPVESHDAVTRVEEDVPTSASVLLKRAFLVCIAC